MSYKIFARIFRALQENGWNFTSAIDSIYVDKTDDEKKAIYREFEKILDRARAESPGNPTPQQILSWAEKQELHGDIRIISREGKEEAGFVKETDKIKPESFGGIDLGVAEPVSELKYGDEAVVDSYKDAYLPKKETKEDVHNRTEIVKDTPNRDEIIRDDRPLFGDPEDIDKYKDIIVPLEEKDKPLLFGDEEPKEEKRPNIRFVTEEDRYRGHFGGIDLGAPKTDRELMFGDPEEERPSLDSIKKEPELERPNLDLGIGETKPLPGAPDMLSDVNKENKDVLIKRKEELEKEVKELEELKQKNSVLSPMDETRLILSKRELFEIVRKLNPDNLTPEGK